MSSSWEALLADAMAQIRENEAPAFPHQLVDEIVVLAHDLEYEMPSVTSDFQRQYAMFRAIAVAALRGMHEMQEECANGC